MKKLLAISLLLVAACSCSKKAPPEQTAPPAISADNVVDKPEFRFKLPVGKWSETAADQGFEYANDSGSRHVAVRTIKIAARGVDTRVRVEQVVESRRSSMELLAGDGGARVSPAVYEEKEGVLSGRFHGLDPANSAFFSFLIISSKDRVISVRYTEQLPSALARAAETDAEARASELFGSFAVK